MQVSSMQVQKNERAAQMQLREIEKGKEVGFD